MARRAWRILWGPTTRIVTGSATVLTLVSFLNQPLMSAIVSTWQGIPWWVGLVVLVPLLFYAFVRASYEEYRAGERAREKLQSRITDLENELEETQSRQQAKGDTLSEDWIAHIEQMKSEIEQLDAENEWLRNQPSDEVLKQRALQLSDELFQFVEERDNIHLQNKLNAALSKGEDIWDTSQEKAQYDDETTSQYHRQYEPEVRALLDALERRRWCDAEQRKEIKNTFVSGWTSSPNERIRRGAARLAAFGKRL